MTLTLFFDTETTGLPKYKHVDALLYSENWPNLVSICWMVFNSNICIKKEYYYIQPKGWIIPQESIKIHGVTQEIAMQKGRPLEEVLHKFQQDIQSCDQIIAHNLHFDKNVVFHAYFWNLKIDPKLFWKSKKEICTVLKSKDELKIPSKYPKQDDLYKYPTLNELYKDTFQIESPGNAHDACRDVEVLQEIVMKRWPNIL